MCKEEKTENHKNHKKEFYTKSYANNFNKNLGNITGYIPKEL